MSGVTRQWCEDPTNVSLSLQDPQHKQQWSFFSPPCLLPQDSFQSSQMVCMAICCLPAQPPPAHRKGKRGIQKRQDHIPEKTAPTKTIQPKCSQIRQAHKSISERSLFWLNLVHCQIPSLPVQALSSALPVKPVFLIVFQRRTKQSSSGWELLCQKRANGRSHPLRLRTSFCMVVWFPFQGFCICPFPNVLFPRSGILKHSKNSCTMTIIILHTDKFLQAFFHVNYLCHNYDSGECFCFLWKLHLFHFKKKKKRSATVLCCGGLSPHQNFSVEQSKCFKGNIVHQ